MNLPLELVDKILQYDGRIKYRKGKFVNVIDPKLLKFYRVILDPLIKKKKKILSTVNTACIGHYLNLFENSDTLFNTRRFYFEFEFTTLQNVGLCYDYYWGSGQFEICYFDLRNNYWEQIKTVYN